jgi:hypothetical protein
VGAPAIRVADVRFTPADYAQARRGLLGWVRCIYGDLRLDSLAIRRTRDGRIVLTFPGRVDGAGRERPYVAPQGDAARRDLEVQILAALGAQGQVLA